MNESTITAGQESQVFKNAANYFRVSRDTICRRTDKFFAYLMFAQWVGGIAAALIVSPKTWSGTESSVHIHVWTAILLGGLISSFPMFLGFFYPGRTITRHVIAISQMLMSGLLIHLTGGRIETHFHIFGSLALIAFYGDWTLLLTAALVTGADHAIRGVYFPLSVYGVAYSSIWRSVEHASWVLFESTFLIWACRVANRDVREVAQKRAELEFLNRRFEERTEEVLEAQAAINEREERIRAILDTAADTIITLNDHSEILTANSAAEHLFGYPVSDLKGRSINDFLQEKSQKLLSESLFAVNGKLEKETKIANCTLKAITRGGGTPSIEVSVSEMTVGTEHMYTAIMRDITQRQIMEMQLNHAQKLDSIGQLAAGIAHEINTPVQFVGDNTRFLQEQFCNILALLDDCIKFATNSHQSAAQQTTAIHQIDATLTHVDFAYLREEIPRAFKESLDGISRIAKIVRAMKEFSHPGNTEKENIDLNRALESTIVISTNEWKYVADIETKFDSSLPLVPCLPGELNQVILNLLVNSAHALAEVKDRGPTGKGLITLSTKAVGDWVEIRLQDTGVGIPKEIANKIFDPFFTTKEVGKGTGQGLAIARSIITKKHGGTIDFESEVGKGTTFIIRLPVKERSAEKASSSEKNATRSAIT